MSVSFITSCCFKTQTLKAVSGLLESVGKCGAVGERERFGSRAKRSFGEMRSPAGAGDRETSVLRNAKHFRQTVYDRSGEFALEVHAQLIEIGYRANCPLNRENPSNPYSC